MELLSKEQRVSVLTYARRLCNDKRYAGMCACMDLALRYELKGLSYSRISDHIKGFDCVTAMEKFGAKIGVGYWWSPDDIESRLKYFDWLIEINGR